jgi:ssDNA-binding Zn-finger/Zn-ribbon topoisomerase 1
MTAQVVFIVVVLGFFLFAGSKGSAPSRRPPSATSSYTNTSKASPAAVATRPPVVDRAPQPTDGCPCGGRWIRKENGATGGRFWGCSNFPRCGNTRDEIMRERHGTHWREIDRPELAVRCKNGHLRTASNTDYNAAGHRICTDCRAEVAREASARAYTATTSSASKAKTRPKPEAPTCRNGHPKTPENTYVRPDGQRECRVCRKNARGR